MGLDMSLYGKVGANGRSEELAYWRKHPNLHGYIVKTFANGVDECQIIPLSISDLRKIIDAVNKRELPHTTGFFFGESFGDEGPSDIQKIEGAIDWLQQRGANARVYYQASW